MKIKFIYKFIPIPVLFTTLFLKDWMNGRSFGVFIIVRPTSKDDKIMLQHELIHCKQFYRTIGFHGILYHLSKRYRLKTELEAYETLVKEKGYLNYLVVTRLLFLNYDLKMTREHIKLKAENYYKGYKK